MKQTTFKLALTGLFLGIATLAQARAYKPHSQVNNPALVTRLHQQMDELSNSFGDMEDNESRTGVNYDKILEAVKKMETAQQTIRKIVPDKAWNMPLGGLSAQLQKVRKAATKRDPTLLREEINGLYDVCFKCHAANAPKDSE